MTNARLKLVRDLTEKTMVLNISLVIPLLDYIDELKALLPNVPDESTPMGTKVKAWNFSDDVWYGEYIGYDSIVDEHLVKYIDTNERRGWSTDRFAYCIIEE